MPNRSSQQDNQYYSGHQYSSTPPVAPQMMNFSTFPSDGTPSGGHPHYVYQHAGGFTGYGGNISYDDTYSRPVASAATNALRYTDPILCPSPSNASTAGQRAYQTLGNAPAPPALSDANDPEAADIDSMINFSADSGSETASTRVDQKPGSTAVIPCRGKHSAQGSRDVKQPPPAARPSPNPVPKRRRPKRLRTSDYVHDLSPFTPQHFTQDPTSPLALTKLDNTSTTGSPMAYGTYPTASSPGYYQIVAEPPAEDDSVFTEE